MWKNTRELKLDHFSALLVTMIAVVGNNVEHVSALWATTRKNCHNAEQ
jgi:hypothetical protein